VNRIQTDIELRIAERIKSIKFCRDILHGELKKFEGNKLPGHNALIYVINLLEKEMMKRKKLLNIIEEEDLV
jgi:hypothetical protein